MPAALANVRDRLEAARARLAAAGIETAAVDAAWLMAGLLGIGRAQVYLHLDEDLRADDASRYAEAVERRCRREPLQQILGWEDFRGLRIAVTPDVLVPRPETEVLVEWALALLPPARAGAPGPLVADVGTGSGCIAAAVARERPDVRVVAVDRSPAAAVLARRNAAALGLAGRVRIVVGDVLDALGGGRFDLVVSNPPYLPSGLVPTLPPEVSDHEPRLALDGGADGLALIRPIVAGALRCLVPGGVLVLETAGSTQAGMVATLLAAAGFTRVATRADLTGVRRLVGARRPADVSTSTRRSRGSSAGSAGASEGGRFRAAEPSSRGVLGEAPAAAVEAPAE